MKLFATPLKKSTLNGIFVLMFSLAAPAAWAGDGTIPLRMTGSVVDSTSTSGLDKLEPTTQSQAMIRKLIRLPQNALKCLSGDDVKKYRADGHIVIDGKKLMLLALCYRQGSGILEMLSVDLRDPTRVTRFRGHATRD
jgi:hypothetical protein